MFNKNYLGHIIKILSEDQFWIDGFCEECNNFIYMKKYDESYYYESEFIEMLKSSCDEMIVKKLLE